MDEGKGRPVVVTTVHRGVFFGYAATAGGSPDSSARRTMTAGRPPRYGG